MDDVWAEVIRELAPRTTLAGAMAARRELGIRRYGRPLGDDDGRDHVRDLVEELLDGIAYAWRLGHRALAVELARRAEEVVALHRRDDLADGSAPPVDGAAPVGAPGPCQGVGQPYDDSAPYSGPPVDGKGMCLSGWACVRTDPPSPS